MIKVVVMPKGELSTRFPKNPNLPASAYITGCEFWIDKKNNRVGMRYYADKEPREWYSINDTWLQKYRFCRTCDKLVKNATFGYAYHRHEQQNCSAKCSHTE